MRIPKSVLVLLIGALLVISVGFIFLATRPEGDRTTFSSQSGPVPRTEVNSLVEGGKVIPTALVEKNSAMGLLAEGTTGFVSTGKSGQPVLIMCPGHRDFVKSAVALLSEHQNWIEVE